MSTTLSTFWNYLLSISHTQVLHTRTLLSLSRKPHTFGALLFLIANAIVKMLQKCTRNKLRNSAKIQPIFPITTNERSLNFEVTIYIEIGFLNLVELYSGKIFNAFSTEQIAISSYWFRLQARILGKNSTVI